MSEVILSARGLSRRYKMGGEVIEVLKDATLEIAAGEMVAVVGASGSGKSTLLHVLGLLDRPDSGEISILGRDALGANARVRAYTRRASIGFVFQFYHLMAELSALENVELAGRMALPGARRLTSKERRARARDLLDRLGLAKRERHRPGQLSGGEKQRVAIARALFHRPALLLCDEPTGNLDRETGGRVWQQLLEARASEGTAMVVVTHDERLAAQCARTLVLEGGVLAPSRPTAAGEAIH